MTRGPHLQRTAGLLAVLFTSGCALMRPMPKPVEPWTSATGLVVYELLKPEGRPVEPGDQVAVHYELRLADGSVLDSSWSRGIPLTFQVGAGLVIAGFDEAMLGMVPGAIRKVVVPPALGYGATGAPPTIPPEAELTFEIELMNVTPSTAD